MVPCLWGLAAIAGQTNDDPISHVKAAISMLQKRAVVGAAVDQMVAAPLDMLALDLRDRHSLSSLVNFCQTLVCVVHVLLHSGAQAVRDFSNVIGYCCQPPVQYLIVVLGST